MSPKPTTRSSSRWPHLLIDPLPNAEAMILALETAVLVAWNMTGAPAHAAAQRLVHREIRSSGRIGITAQVLFEFLHIVTDRR